MRWADVEALCLALPGTTLDHPFGDSNVFKVGGKMFALITMEGKRPGGLWFKAGETSYRLLIQEDGISPCPYLARAHWVALDSLKVLKDREIKAYLSRAHGLVASGLSKKKRAELGIDVVLKDEIFDPFA